MGEPGGTLVEVGDRVQIRANGGSPAARKYAGEKGRVTMISSGFDRIMLDVRIGGNNFDTVLEDSDLDATEVVGLFSGLKLRAS